MSANGNSMAPDGICSVTPCCAQVPYKSTLLATLLARKKISPWKIIARHSGKKTHHHITCISTAKSWGHNSSLEKQLDPKNTNVLKMHAFSAFWSTLLPAIIVTHLNKFSPTVIKRFRLQSPEQYAILRRLDFIASLFDEDLHEDAEYP